MFLPMDSFINQKEIAEGWEGERERRRGSFVAVSREDCLQKVSAASAGLSLQAGSQWCLSLSTQDRNPRGADAATAETP